MDPCMLDGVAHAGPAPSASRPYQLRRRRRAAPCPQSQPCCACYDPCRRCAHAVLPFRYWEDLEAARRLGCNSVRLSIEWARLMPHGPGTPPDPEAAARYLEILDAARAMGLQVGSTCTARAVFTASKWVGDAPSGILPGCVVARGWAFWGPCYDVHGGAAAGRTLLSSTRNPRLCQRHPRSQLGLPPHDQPASLQPQHNSCPQPCWLRAHFLRA